MTLTSEFEAVPTPPHTNHAAERAVVIQLQDHKASGGGPRVGKTVKWIPLQESGEYQEHQIRARIRYPEQINADYFNSGSEGSIRDGLKLVVLEHNGWIDPESDTDQVLPPVDQKCTFETALAEALKAEDITYAVALKEARTEAAKSVAETTHARAVRQLHLDSQQRKAERTEPCCFWDSVSQEEVILMLRAITSARGNVLTFLLETKTS